MYSAERVHVRVVLTIWQAWAQCCAGERVCSPFGKHVCIAERVHVSGRACHLVAERAGAAERACLPFSSQQQQYRVWGLGFGCPASHNTFDFPANNKVPRGGRALCFLPVDWPTPKLKTCAFH